MSLCALQLHRVAWRAAGRRRLQGCRPEQQEQQRAASGGGLRGSATREVIENSKKALNLLQREHPTFKPTLSIVQVINDDLGQEKIRNVAEEIGLNVVHICIPHDYTENEVVDEITKVNINPKIHGVLLHPMKESYTSKILNAVKPEKDVNGITDFNLARLVHGNIHECVVPPIASAVVKLLEKLTSTPLERKKALLLGVQGPLEVSLQCLLQQRGVLTISCPWEMKQLQSVVLDADIMVLGRTKLKEIPTTWLKPEMTVLDCSQDILWDHNCSGMQLARQSNQIPGETVGELAVAMCMQNLVKISERWIRAQQYKKWDLRCLKLHPLTPVPRIQLGS